MKVQDIKRLGYFDDITIDGWIDPMYRSNGIVLYQDMGLCESINFCNKQSSNSIAHLHIEIFGVGNENDTAKILNTRDKLGLYPDKYNRYSIAYLEIIIIKDEYSLPNEIDNKGRNIQTIRGISKASDEMDLYESGLRIAKYASKYNLIKKDFSDMNIAIIDRVYINKNFRRLGINNWIHENITDIINTFGMRYPDVILLIPGDFANESESYFNMTNDEYINMLNNMYINCGYKSINIFEKWFIRINNKNILFKLNK